MKKFLIKGSLFFIPLLCIFLCLEYKLFEIPNSYNTKKANLEKQKADIEVLITGASHVYYGFNPEYFSHKGFNLANASQSVYYDTRIIKTYAASMPKLKLLVMSIDLSTLYFQVSNSKEEWRNYFYSRFWHIDYPGLPVFDARRYSMMALYSQQKTIEYIKAGFKVNLADDLRQNGYAFNDSTGDTSTINAEAGNARAALHSENINDHKNTILQASIAANIRDIDETIRFLKDRGVSVVLVTTPCYHTYTDYCSPAIVSFNDSVIHDLCSRYGCTYHNYFTDKAFTIRDFFDNDHLNARGAILLSKKVDSEIIKPYFENRK